LRHLEGMVDGLADPYRFTAKPSRRGRVAKQVVSQQSVQVEDGVAVEADLVSRLDQKFDGRLVIEDHLRFGRGLPFGGLPQFDQTLRVEQRVGVAFETAR